MSKPIMSEPFQHPIVFATYGEALQFASLKPKPGTPEVSRNLGSRNDSWSKTTNFADAETLALTGWLEGAELISRLSDALVDKLSSMVIRPRIVYDVVGEVPDIGLALTGVPEFMMRSEERLEQQDGHVVRIVVNVSASSSISASALIARGVVLAALVQLLEIGGMRAEVVTVWCADRFASFTTPVKYADQPLDMPRLAFTLAHPAMLRRLMFSCLEQFPVGFPGAYGRPTNIGREHRGDIYAPSMWSGTELCDWENESEVREWILSALRSQGVTVTLE